MSNAMQSLEAICQEKGLKMTEQRRIVVRVLSDASGHPDVEEVYAMASKIDSKISIATVYRTVRILEESGLIQKHTFGDGRARYETVSDDHHDHLIDIDTKEVIEFFDADIESLKSKIAERYGYTLIDHRLELYGRKKKPK
jgi:Fur family ferric uptake transcriptional regulator